MMAVTNGLLTTRDFSVNPGTSWVVDIPAGYTIASISAIGIGVSASGTTRIQLSVGGVVQVIPIRVFFANATASQVVDVGSSGIGLTDSGTSGLYGACTMYNFNTAAPVSAFYENYTSTYRFRSIVFKSATPAVQIYIDSTGGGTLNAGTIYVQLYQRATSVIAHDFAATPITNWDIPSLTDADASLITLTAYDLTLSSAAAISARVSTDGITFDATAGDYRLGYVHASADVVVSDSKATVAQTGGTAQGLCSVFLGVPVSCKSLWMTTDMRVMGSNAILSMGNREVRQIETALRVYAQAGTINGGTGYAVKYAL